MQKDETLTADEEAAEDLNQSTPEASNPVSMKRITSGTDFIKEVEGEDPPEIVRWQTSRGEVGVAVIGGDDLSTVFTACYRENNEGQQEFDSLKTSEKIFLLSIHYGVVDDKGESLFTVGNLTKMYSGKKKKSYTQFLNECWDGVVTVNWWLDVKNPNSLRRMIRMLFG